MGTFEKMGFLSSLAKVRQVDPAEERLYLEFRNGMVAPMDGVDCTEYSVGAIVLVTPEQNHIETAPEELWTEDSWIGIVRLKLTDLTVIASGGLLKAVKNLGEVDYEVGNTVEVKESTGVVRVLSENSIKDLDFYDASTIVSKFKQRDGGHSTLADFGGSQAVVERAIELIVTPLQYKEQMSKIGAKPTKGVLFTGPPGVGKTMLARILANIVNAAFYEVNGPEIFSKWVGESEETLRQLFDDAAKEEQAVIFFDEIDSIATGRGNTTHETSHRVVAQLLTLMDGFVAHDGIVVVAATNRPEQIDPALLRPGRFDAEIRFSMPDSYERELILRVSCRRLSTRGSLSHKWVAQRTEGWSPAELTAIWREASLLAVADGRTVIMEEDYVAGYERIKAGRRKTE